MYQRNKDSMWRRIKLATITGLFLHFPFFIFTSSYTFSDQSIFTAYFLFFYDLLFWFLWFPLAFKFAGRGGKILYTAIGLGWVAVFAVLHNGIGVIATKSKWKKKHINALYCDVSGFFLFFIMLIALVQGWVYFVTLYVGRMPRYNPKYNFEPNTNSSLVRRRSSDHPRSFGNGRYMPQTDGANTSPNVNIQAANPISPPIETIDPAPVNQAPPEEQPYIPDQQPYIPEDLPYNPNLTSSEIDKD